MLIVKAIVSIAFYAFVPRLDLSMDSHAVYLTSVEIY